MRGDKERGRREKEKSFEWSRGVLPQSTVEMGPNASGVVAVVIFSADPFMGRSHVARSGSFNGCHSLQKSCTMQ